MASSSGLHLYTAATPNGHKVSNYVEELKARYPSSFKCEYHAVSLGKNEQKEPWFLRVNPNGRIPALTDDGFGVFESASILLWLAEKYDVEREFWWDDKTDPDFKLRSQAYSWIFFIHGGVGPMQGQANHFNRYAPEDVPYGKARYTNETRRLYSVLESALEGREWLVGPGKGKYSVADINAFPWLFWHKWAGVPDSDVGPNVLAYIRRNYARSAVQAGMAVPERSELLEAQLDPEFEKNYAEKAKQKAEEAKKWIQQGMKDDAAKK